MFPRNSCSAALFLEEEDGSQVPLPEYSGWFCLALRSLAVPLWAQNSVMQSMFDLWLQSLHFGIQVHEDNFSGWCDQQHCYVPSEVLVTLYNPNVEPCRIQLKTSSGSLELFPGVRRIVASDNGHFGSSDLVNQQLCLPLAKAGFRRKLDLPLLVGMIYQPH